MEKGEMTVEGDGIGNGWDAEKGPSLLSAPTPAGVT